MDIDEASVRASRENADANDIATEQFVIGLGSVTEIREGKFPIRQAPLVLANILAPIIIRLFGMGLADLVEPAACSSFPASWPSRPQAVQAAAEQNGLRFVEKQQLGDWVAITCRR